MPKEVATGSASMFDCNSAFDLGLWEAMGFRVTYFSGQGVRAYNRSGDLTLELHFRRWKPWEGPATWAMASISRCPEDGEGFYHEDEFLVCHDDSLRWLCRMDAVFLERL